jgi:hypothetical protein
MMDFNKIVPLLGKSERDEQVIALLSELDVRQPIPRPKKDSSTTYVEFVDSPSAIYFVFEAVEAIKVLKKEDYLEGELIFHTASFCPHEDEISYDNVIPYGVDLRKDMSWHTKKLGHPQWNNQRLGNYRWLVDGIFVFLKFSDDGNKILKVSYFIYDGVF